MWNLFHLQTQYLLNFCCAIKTEKNIKFGWLSWVGQNWAIFDSSTFLVLDFFFLSDAGWFSIEEAILGLDAEDAKEARARSWQVGGVGLVTFCLPWTLWLGLVFVVFLYSNGHNSWLYYVLVWFGLVWFNASRLNAPPSLFLLTNRKVGNHQVLHAVKCLFVRCKRKEEC